MFVLSDIKTGPIGIFTTVDVVLKSLKITNGSRLGRLHVTAISTKCHNIKVIDTREDCVEEYMVHEVPIIEHPDHL